MKKILLFLMVFILIFIVACPFAAFAASEDVGTGEGFAISEFFTWTLLATYAGCLAATLLLTQLLKGIWFASWPTQILSYIIALVTLIGANWALGELTWNSGLISIFNAAIVSLAANGGFDNFKSLTTKKE